tara:strand:+ start:42 stop:1286 length:1245 start_codon:yes stop_codon:yes gene_type:complete
MPTGQELLDAEIADVKLKIKNSTSPKLTKGFVRKLRNLEQKAGDQRIGIDAKSGTKGRVAVDTGKQAHHRTSLNNAAAFFEDLDIPEKTIMGQKFAQYGLVPGDLTMNRLDMFAELHQGGIHAIERFLGLEGKPYFKPGATLVEKLAVVESFAADQKLLSSLADRMQFSAEFKTPGLTERVLSTATTKSAEEYKTKANRRLANQKLDFLQYIPEQHEVATALGPQLQSQNKARLAALDAYFNDDNSFDVARLKKDVATNKFVLPTPEPATPFEMSKGSAKLNRKQLTALAAMGVTTYSALGSVASAAETAGRTQLAQQSGNPLDYVQAGLSGVSLAGDAVGVFPPAGPVGEIVSTVADVANIGIDVARDPEPLVNVYNKIKEDPLNELEYLGKQAGKALSFFGSAVRMASPLGL